MKSSILLFHIFLLLFSITEVQGQIVPYGATWRYYDLENEPAAQGNLTWRDKGYVDTTWQIGPAQLGYGDNDEATTINENTFVGYFRKTFIVDSTTLLDQLAIQLLFDDGAVLYINGFEVWRVNMPEGPIDYSTFASATSGDNALDTLILENNLTQGLNVIAVEVHQRSASSSDISFDLSLSDTTGYIPSILIRGPYLQKGAHDRVTIKWRTSEAVTSIVEYGLTLNALNNTVSEMTLKMEHEIELTGLTAETIYYYRLQSGNQIVKEENAQLYFKTHPSIGDDKPFTAWILGDCGTGNANARAVRNAYYGYIGSGHTDMILFLGDNAYNDGTDTEYQTALFENMYEQKLQNSIAWSCLGNHDGHSAFSSTQSGPYYDIFTFPKAGESGGMSSGTEAYYSFDYGSTHFIVLDSYDSDRSVGGDMYNWCLNDIQNTTAKWIVAFWHHPPYTKGSHDSDSESALIQMRERFLPILEDNGVDLILSGHSHSYERSYYLNGHYGPSDSFDSQTHTVGSNGFENGQITGGGAYRKPINGPDQGDGTVYITTGSSGKTSSGALDHEAMFYSVSALGSCVLEVNKDTMQVKFIRNTGAIEDQFAIIKCRGHETVWNNADAGAGSLRQTITDACPCDTILFASNLVNPIMLQSEINLNKKLFFSGPQVFNSIDGNGTNRIFNIQMGTEITIDNMTFKNAFAPTNGGAIFNQGLLYLKNVIFENNMDGANPRSITNRGEIVVMSNGLVELRE